MASKYRKNYRKKYRKMKRYLKKKSYRKKKKISGYMKNPTRRTQQSVWIRGIKKKLDNRPELKMTSWALNNLTIAGPNGNQILWNPNSEFMGTAQRAIQPPTQGDGENNFIGTKFNSLSAHVRFSMEVTNDTLINDYLRIAVVRPTISSHSNVAGTFPPIPSNIIQFFNQKDWIVYYDKVFPYTTATTNITPPKVFQFKIPLKETIGFAPGQIFPIWDRPPIILWSTRNGGHISLTQFAVRYYYRDP